MAAIRLSSEAHSTGCQHDGFVLRLGNVRAPHSIARQLSWLICNTPFVKVPIHRVRVARRAHPRLLREVHAPGLRAFSNGRQPFLLDGATPRASVCGRSIVRCLTLWLSWFS